MRKRLILANVTILLKENNGPTIAIWSCLNSVRDDNRNAERGDNK